MGDGPPEPDDTCASCGEKLDEHASECYRCGYLTCPGCFDPKEDAFCTHCLEEITGKD